MNPFIERTIHWGILHIIVTHNFKDYTNITFVDEKFNLCDYFDDVINEQCPLKQGIYRIQSGTIIPSLFWPVSNRYSVSLLLFYFIGSVFWQSHCLQ